MMKIKLLTVLLLVGTLLISCEKDDEKSELKNYFKIDDTEYIISDGILENYGMKNEGDWYDGYNTDLTFVSEGFSVQTDEDGFWDFTGDNGEFISFEMFSKDGNALDNHIYTYSSTEPCPIGTFDIGIYVIVVDDEEEEDNILSGTISVSKSGNEYSITIDCTSVNGKKITGFYKGTLHYNDLTIE